MPGKTNRIMFIIKLLIVLSILPWVLILSTSVEWSAFISGDWMALITPLGNTIGLIGLTLIMWQFILGSRFIIRKVSRDTIKFNGIHQFLGKYGLVLVFLHPVLEMIEKETDLSFLYTFSFGADPEETAISFGRTAFILFVVLWLSSALLRSRLKYRPWLKIHYVAYLLPPLLIIHAITVNDFTSSSFEFGLFLYWSAIGTLYGIFTVLRILAGYGIGKTRYTIGSISHVGEITILGLQPLDKDKFILAEPGQYAYFQIDRFGEAHPFSIVSSTKDQLRFGIKAVGPFSRDISKLEVSKIVYIDGPYGVFTLSGHNQDSKVIIAGGIGITPFVELIDQYPENTTLINCNRYLEDVPFRDQLQDKLKTRYFDLLSRDDIKAEQVINGRLSQSVLDQIIPDKQYSNYNYYICSGTPLLKAALELLEEIGVPDDQIEYEAFAL